MSDVTHGHGGGHNHGAYLDNKVRHKEWTLNKHSMCVTHPAAEAIWCLEGAKYVTISLVLPAIYKLLGNLEKDYLRQHWDDTIVPVASIGHKVKKV